MSISLRQYYAAKAMAVLLKQSAEKYLDPKAEFVRVRNLAFEMADTMIMEPAYFTPAPSGTSLHCPNCGSIVEPVPQNKLNPTEFEPLGHAETQNDPEPTQLNSFSGIASELFEDQFPPI